MTIIGKNTLTGSGATLSSIQPKIFSGGVAAVLPATHEIISANIGWKDGLGASGTGSIEIGLYDITSGVDNAPLIAASVQTINYDNDALSGDQFLSITGLSIDLSAYSGQTLAASLANPVTSGLPIMLDSSGTRNDHTSITATLPDPFVLGGSQTQAFAVYFETAVITTDPDITDIDTNDDVFPGQSADITGTNFGGVEGDVSLGGVAQTVTAWADTEITITVVQSGLKYGDHDLIVTDDSAVSSAALTTTLSPSSTNQFVNVSSPVSDNTSLFFGASPAVVTGDQLEAPLLTTQGKTLTINADGTFVITAASGLQTFSIRVWDATDETWSTSAIATINGEVTPPSSIGGSMARAMVNG